MSLTKSERVILRALYQRGFRTQENLRDELYWLRSEGEKPKSKNAMRVFMTYLRKKAPEGAIATVWGEGYRLTPIGKEWARAHV